MPIINTRKTSNPFLKESAMQKAAFPMAGEAQDKMTIYGAINKTMLLFAIMMVTTMISFYMPNQLFLWVGAIGGIITVIVASIKQVLSPFLAPIFALLEGLFVGTITAYYAAAYQGIVFHAVTLTASMLFLMLVIYRLKIVTINQKFRAGVIMATGSVMLVYLMNWILGMFGISMPFLHDGGTLSIVISLVIIGIAGLNLLLDFDLFEKGQEYGAPKYMEWFAGMGLLITLVWLYIEFLRLLSILQRR